MLIRVVAPHFVAGLIVKNNVVIKTAPILKANRGKLWSEVRAYIDDRPLWAWEFMGKEPV